MKRKQTLFLSMGEDVPGPQHFSLYLGSFPDPEQEATDLMCFLSGAFFQFSRVIRIDAEFNSSPGPPSFRSTTALCLVFSLPLFTERKCVTFLDEQTAKGVWEGLSFFWWQDTLN